MVVLATSLVVLFPNVSIHLRFLRKWILFSNIFLLDDLVSVWVLTFGFVLFAIFISFFLSLYSIHITHIIKLSDQTLLNGEKINNNYCFHLMRYIFDLSRFVQAQYSSHEQKANKEIRCVKLNECLMENKWLTSQDFHLDPIFFPNILLSSNKSRLKSNDFSRHRMINMVPQPLCWNGCCGYVETDAIVQFGWNKNKKSEWMEII